MKRYTYSEAAAELRVNQRWLERNIKRLPHSKKGRVVTFSDADLERIDQMFHHEPTVGPLAVVADLPSASGAHPLASLRPLPPRGTPLRTG